MKNDIIIYAKGLVHCSICVPSDYSPDDVESGVNLENPTGIDSQWKIDKENFKDGTKNPSKCEQNTRRQHYLMVC